MTRISTNIATQRVSVEPLAEGAPGLEVTLPDDGTVLNEARKIRLMVGNTLTKLTDRIFVSTGFDLSSPDFVYCLVFDDEDNIVINQYAHVIEHADQGVTISFQMAGDQVLINFDSQARPSPNTVEHTLSGYGHDGDGLSSSSAPVHIVVSSSPMEWVRKQHMGIFALTVLDRQRVQVNFTRAKYDTNGTQISKSDDDWLIEYANMSSDNPDVTRDDMPVWDEDSGEFFPDESNPFLHELDSPADENSNRFDSFTLSLDSPVDEDSSRMHHDPSFMNPIATDFEELQGSSWIDRHNPIQLIRRAGSFLGQTFRKAASYLRESRLGRWLRSRPASPSSKLIYAAPAALILALLLLHPEVKKYTNKLKPPSTPNDTSEIQKPSELDEAQDDDGIEVKLNRCPSAEPCEFNDDGIPVGYGCLKEGGIEARGADGQILIDDSGTDIIFYQEEANGEVIGLGRLAKAECGWLEDWIKLEDVPRIVKEKYGPR